MRLVTFELTTPLGPVRRTGALDGADHVIDVQTEDPLARIKEITGGKGVDISLDCTAGAGACCTVAATGTATTPATCCLALKALRPL